MAYYEHCTFIRSVSQSVIAIANEDMMGAGCYCLLPAYTLSQLSLLVFGSLPVSAQELHNSFRSYDDDDVDGKVAMGKKQQHERSSCSLFLAAVTPDHGVCMHGIFGIVAIAIIRNVCTHKMCYGLLFSTLSQSLTLYIA